MTALKSGVVTGWIALILLTACSDSQLSGSFYDEDGDTECIQGDLGCECLDDGKCNGDLVCVDDICIDPGEVPDGDDGSDGDDSENEEAETDDDDRTDGDNPTDGDETCEESERRCAGENTVEECIDGEWKVVEQCECGHCEDAVCVIDACDLAFDHCEGTAAAVYSAGNDECCPPYTDFCAEGSICIEEEEGCVELPTDGDIEIPPDGDIDNPIDGDYTENEEDETESCDDSNPCTEDVLTGDGCANIPIECAQDDNPCTLHVCDTATGTCAPNFVPDGICPVEGVQNPCMTSVCVESSMVCEYVTNDEGNCDDGLACNGEEYCQDGSCLHRNPIICPECYSCNDTTGDCYCDGSCTEESCNGQDDDCDGAIDEDDVCNDPEKGIRVELSWSNWGADMDVHFLNPEGVFGSSSSADTNDCYPGNRNPNWGDLAAPGDDPVHHGDVTHGYGNNDTPEWVRLALPEDIRYRVLVYFPNMAYVPEWLQDNDAWVRIYLDGTLAAQYSSHFDRSRAYWNVACIDYHAGEVTAITDAEGNQQKSLDNLDGIDSSACSGANASCVSTCDCNLGLRCIDGVCSSSEGGLYCCGRSDCAKARYCESDAYGLPGTCGFTVDFESNTQGQYLDPGVDVQFLYSMYGVNFYTNRPDSVVATDAWELDSDSRNNSCGTLDTDGTRWLGDVNISFSKPAQPDTIIREYAGATRVGFYVGETHDERGLLVSAYDFNDNELYAAWVNRDSYVDIDTEELIFRVKIEPNNDPNFVIDDLWVEQLIWPN